MTDEQTMSITLDANSDVPIYSPVCMLCARLDRDAFVRGDRRCIAFRDQPIPDAIWRGDNDHRGPFSGDHGLLFKPHNRKQARAD